MADFLTILLLPFMARAIIAGIILGALLAYLGVFVTLRRLSFFGDGIAHASLAGIAIGIALGIYPFAIAVALAAVLGALLYYLERRLQLASDAIIGVIFTTGMAIGIVILSLQPGFQPELFSFLFGSILALTTADVLTIAVAAAIILPGLVWLTRALTLTSLDRDTAWLAGIHVTKLELAFYVVLAMAVVLGVKLLGVILVSALLIIPPTAAKLVASSFQRFIIVSLIISELAVLGGLFGSYYLDVPSGAMIVLAATSLFVFVAIVSSLFKRSPHYA